MGVLSMNILLVDDDVYTIEALKQSLDWKELGIENAYYAYGTSQAKKIMEDVPIHILVSDIEMPKENGFALLEWIREKGYIVQEILLTMYAEFQYAKQAIQYDCFAYVLKPINYEELSEMIKGAIKKENEELKNISNAYYSDLWASSTKMRKEHFFSNLVLEHSTEEIYDLDYEKEDFFLPVLIRNFEKTVQADENYGQGMEEWEIKNILRKSFSKSDISYEAVVKSAKGFFTIIFLAKKLEKENLKQAILEYFKELRQKKNLSAAAFIGIPADWHFLGKNIPEFEYFALHQLAEPQEILETDSYEYVQIKYQPPDFRKWEKLLNDRQMCLLKSEIDTYFEVQQKGGSVTYQNLYRVTGDFLQMIYAVLKTNGIVPYEMTDAIFSEELIARARMYVSETKHALCQMAETAIRLMTVGNSEKTIENKVIEYIEENIDQEMTRESMAEMVFLNPDYLARIFKKKTNTSIGNYILEKRVELAKMYLEKTDEPVNLVAVKCGYDNFSYFAKVFKGKTSYTPKDYRKQFLHKNNTI